MGRGYEEGLVLVRDAPGPHCGGPGRLQGHCARAGGSGGALEEGYAAEVVGRGLTLRRASLGEALEAVDEFLVLEGLVRKRNKRNQSKADHKEEGQYGA